MRTLIFLPLIVCYCINPLLAESAVEKLLKNEDGWLSSERRNGYAWYGNCSRKQTADDFATRDFVWPIFTIQ